MMSTCLDDSESMMSHISVTVLWYSDETATETVSIFRVLGLGLESFNETGGRFPVAKNRIFGIFGCQRVQSFTRLGTKEKKETHFKLQEQQSRIRSKGVGSHTLNFRKQRCKVGRKKKQVWRNEWQPREGAGEAAGRRRNSGVHSGLRSRRAAPA